MWDLNTALPLGALSLLAYVIGSVNTTLVTARMLKLSDVRSLGSGNPGATNIFRTAGAKVAIPVLIADLAKAWIVIWLAKKLLPPEIAPFLLIPLVIGNLFPLFHGFRGGKGVAAAVGGTLALSPLTMLLGGCCFLVVFGLTRRVSAGSLIMVISYPFIGMAIEKSQSEFAATAILAAIVIATHRANIVRLVRGREPAIRASKGEGR